MFNVKVLMILLALLTTLDVEVIVAEERPEYPEIKEYDEEAYDWDCVTPMYNVMSEGVSTYYHNTYIPAPRNTDQPVITGTAYSKALDADVCVGAVDDGDTNGDTFYTCVVLPEELADTYARGDVINVYLDDPNDGVDAVLECIVIDYNQTEHGGNLNFVGDYHYVGNETACVAEQ